MKHGHMLAKGTTDSTQGTQFSRTKGGNESTKALFPSISIGGVGAYQFIGGADPGDALGFDKVEEGKFIVLETVRFNVPVLKKKRLCFEIRKL